ncbi:MAG: DUF6328 family protein [Thermomicrobiales bacterium]
MTDYKTNRQPDNASLEAEHGDGDLSDLLQELRVLLPGVQTLTGFLIILPFSQGFSKIDQNEQWVYLALFICAISSLVLFTAPAAQHRLERPLRDRVRFKRDATRLIIIRLMPLSLALILATHLVVTEVEGRWPGIIITAIVTVIIGVTWWWLPLLHRRGRAVPTAVTEQ